MVNVGYGDPKDKLINKLTSLKLEFFSNYHKQIDLNRQFYNLDFNDTIVPVGWEDRLPSVIPPTARRAIDEAADHILYTPRIKVPARPTTSRHVTEQQIAETKRRFLNAWWSQVTQRYNPIGDGRKPLMREGRICIKHILRWEVIPDKGKMNARQYKSALDKLGKYEFLWDTQLLDNKTVFEDPSNHRDPAYVFVEYEIIKEEADRLFPDAKGSWTKLDDYSKVTYAEYWSRPTFNADGTWDPGDYIQWINQERVNEEENPYPYIPIAIEDAGFGDNYRGATIDEKYVGLTQHTRDMFVAEARQMTSWEAVTEITAFPPIFARNMDSTRSINIGPGEITRLEGGVNEPGAESIEIARWPDIPQGVMKLVDKTTAYANSQLKMDVLGGLPLPGVDTATEASQQIQNASSKLQGPLSALERIAIKMSRWVLMDVELVINAPVTVYGTKATDASIASLSPKEIKGYYDASCEFRTSDADSISQTKARFWADMYARVPFFSAMSAMEKGDIADDGMTEMAKRSAEDIMLSPEMRSIRTMTAAQAYGQMAAMIAAMQEQGGPSETTGTPQPIGAPNGGGSATAGLVGTGSGMDPAMAEIMGTAYGNRDANVGGQFNA